MKWLWRVGCARRVVRWSRFCALLVLSTIFADASRAQEAPVTTRGLVDEVQFLRDNLAATGSVLTARVQGLEKRVADELDSLRAQVQKLEASQGAVKEWAEKQDAAGSKRDEGLSTRLSKVEKAIDGLVFRSISADARKKWTAYFEAPVAGVCILLAGGEVALSDKNEQVWVTTAVGRSIKMKKKDVKVPPIGIQCGEWYSDRIDNRFLPGALLFRRRDPDKDEVLGYAEPLVLRLAKGQGLQCCVNDKDYEIHRGAFSCRLIFVPD